MLECHLHRLESNFSITAYFTFLKRKVHFKCVLLPRTRLCYFVFQFPVSPLQMNFRGARTAETDLHVNCHQKETVAVIESWNAQVSSNYDISCTKNTTVVVTLGKLKGKDFFFFGDMCIVIVHLLQASIKDFLCTYQGCIDREIVCWVYALFVIAMQWLQARECLSS